MFSQPWRRRTLYCKYARGPFSSSKLLNAVKLELENVNETQTLPLRRLEEKKKKRPDGGSI